MARQRRTAQTLAAELAKPADEECPTEDNTAEPVDHEDPVSEKDVLDRIAQFNVRRSVETKLKQTKLPIPKALGDQDQIVAAWDTVLSQHGGKISVISSDVLGDFLERLTQASAYAGYVEAWADLDFATAEEVKDYAETQLYLLQDDVKDSLLKAHAKKHPVYVAKLDAYLKNRAFYKLVRKLREGYDRRADAISREISRRSSELDRQLRLKARGGA